ARALAFPAHCRSCTRRAGRCTGRARTGARSWGQRRCRGEGSQPLRFAAGDRGDRAPGRRREDSRVRTFLRRQVRVLRAAAGGTGTWIRRAMAHRLAGLRRSGVAHARPGRGRAHRRLHPPGHGASRAWRARAPGSRRLAQRLEPGMSDGNHMARPALYLVDASMYVFRAWHSMPDEFHDDEGWPTNAVHGFARFLLELLERERPRHIAIAFDEALDSCFRNTLYPAYKANRDP